MRDYTPKPFTPSQRSLFSKITDINRARPADFVEADAWIGTPPPSAKDKKQDYIDEIRKEAAERYRRKDPCWMLSPNGQMHHDWKQLQKWERRYWRLYPPPSGWTYREDLDNSDPSWPLWPLSKAILASWRRDRARTIRFGLMELNERIKEETAHGPLRPAELIDKATSRFIHTDDPIVFDALNPEQKALWSRRILRLLWIMTDTADLTATNEEWLQAWKWGTVACEIDITDDDRILCYYTRLWSRVTELDPEIEFWERLGSEAVDAYQAMQPHVLRAARDPTKMTRKDLDAELRRIVAGEPRYETWKASHAIGGTEHLKDAERVFSRNTIYESFRFRGVAKAWITDSDAWQKIRNEIGIGQREQKKPAAWQMSEQEEGSARADIAEPIDQMVRDETIRLIRKARYLPPSAKEQLHRGLIDKTISDDEARDILKRAKEQRADALNELLRGK